MNEIEDPAQRRTEEWRTWVFLTVVMAPVITVALVSGFGFAVWIWQLLAGPATY